MKESGGFDFDAEIITHCGIEEVDWKMQKEQFCIRISAPAGVRKRVILPDGEIVVFTDTGFRK